jgi:hypothetical protein
MILYFVELCNEQLKRAQAVNQPANNLAQSNTNKYKSENLIPESPLEWLVKYLKIAREALRVSVEEEMRGSDGTFTPL